MRIVQLIDSLDSGGAERMAINYANALEEKIAFSGIVVSRKEGLLFEKINNKTSYCFLNKKTIIDFKSIFILSNYIKKNKINFIHAHSTSFFLAVLVKITYPKVKIIWHDHYGNSEFLENRKHFVLKLFSLFFYQIIVVNKLLLEWNKKKLFCSKVVYLENFPEIIGNENTTVLQGLPNKRILCLANIRPQKNLEMLIEIAKIICEKHKDYTFHIVGKKFQDAYQELILNLIKINKLENKIFLYDSRIDISNIIKQSSIGVLTSKSEGLPVSVLEFGLLKLPVVATNVGQIYEVIIDGKTGFLVENNNVNSFVNKLEKLIINPEICFTLAENLFFSVQKKYSKETIIKKYLKLLN